MATEGLARYPDFSVQGIARALDYIGTACFAISGTLTAAAADMDLLGCMMVGTITAIGGGTIRDALLGKGPVFWLTETEYLPLSLFFSIGTFLVCLIFFDGSLSQWPLPDTHPVMFWGDTFGIGTFSVVGTMVPLRLGYTNLFVVIVLAILTATGGGMVRDTLCLRPVRVLHTDSGVYATAAAVGSVVYLFVRVVGGPVSLRIVCGMICAILCRVLTFWNHTTLPTLQN